MPHKHAKTDSISVSAIAQSSKRGRTPHACKWKCWVAASNRVTIKNMIIGTSDKALKIAVLAIDRVVSGQANAIEELHIVLKFIKGKDVFADQLPDWLYSEMRNS